MFRAQLFRVLAITVAWTALARGEEAESAEALLVRSYATLTSLPNMEVTVTMRELHAVEQRSGPTRAENGFRLLSAAYQQLRVTRRLPDDWRLVSQRERESNGQILPDRKLVFGKMGEGDAVVMVLNQTTKEPTRAPIPAGLFRQEILERAGAGLRDDPVLSALMFNRADTGLAAFGFENVSRSGPDEAKGVRLTRLAATGARAGGARITIWVDDATGLITRVLQVPPGGSAGPMRRIVETIYAYDFTRGADRADFDLDEGWAAAVPGFVATSGFVPMAEAFALVGAPGLMAPTAPGLRPEGRPTVPGGPGGATSGAVVASAPGAAAVEEQLLTPQQMEAIVLVEGDDGVGSGFVARIREVDFVVTNQHVIGGNGKVRVTTVRGVPVKVGAIFGGVGRDIAILRIEGENTVPALKIAEDPVKTTKLGDKVAVVGNRRGGGVATQVSGVVRGIGPDKIEVDAPFQPGNSGSPIVHVASGEVIGLATYSLTRRLDMLDGPTGKTAAKADGEPATEQRWFGHRADGIARWEAIDQAKWRAQAKRVADFSEDSEAIYYAMNGRFKEASANLRVRQVIDRFEERVGRLGSTQTIVGQEVQEFFRGLRALAESGIKDMRTGDYYDYFRTNMYWETSITEQLRAREEIARRLDKASENTAAFLAKVRR